MSLLSILKSLLFTEPEARVYVSLLKNSPATSYAISENSGVPRSEIYEVLDNLIKRGDILVSPGNPQFYRALPPKSLIAARREQAQKNFSAAEKLLDQLEPNETDDGDIWNIKSRDSILQKVRECINNSRKRILLEIWSEDFKEIFTELKSAAQRGVKIIIVAYGAIVADFAEVYLRNVNDEKIDEHDGRWIVFSVDDSQIIIGTLSLDEKNRAAWTMHSGLVVPITEGIIHDLYVAEIFKQHKDILEKSFGKNLINLRRKFLIETEAINETSTNSTQD